MCSRTKKSVYFAFKVIYANILADKAEGGRFRIEFRFYTFSGVSLHSWCCETLRWVGPPPRKLAASITELILRRNKTQYLTHDSSNRVDSKYCVLVAHSFVREVKMGDFGLMLRYG